jgi:hypothetical protein
MLEVINYFELPAYVVKRRKKMNLSFLIVNMNRRKTVPIQMVQVTMSMMWLLHLSMSNV